MTPLDHWLVANTDVVVAWCMLGPFAGLALGAALASRNARWL